MPTNADLVYAMYDARPTNYVFGGSRWDMNNTDCSGMVDGAFWKVFGISPYSLGTWTGAIWNSPELERIHFGTSPNLPWDIMQIGDVISTSYTSPTFSTGEGSHVGFYTGNPDAPFVSHFANGGPYVTAVNGVYGGREIYFGVQRYMPGSDDMNKDELIATRDDGNIPAWEAWSWAFTYAKDAAEAAGGKSLLKKEISTQASGNIPVWQAISWSYTYTKQLAEKLDAMQKKLDKLQSGGGSVDYDKLANAVADKLAARMKD